MFKCEKKWSLKENKAGLDLYDYDTAGFTIWAKRDLVVFMKKLADRPEDILRQLVKQVILAEGFKGREQFSVFDDTAKNDEKEDS